MTRILCLFALVLPSIAPARQPGATARMHHRSALEAIESHAWDRAMELLRQAIELDPVESTNGVVHYLPHFYLGMSQVRSHNCVFALESLAVSERQGAVQRAGLADELQALTNACREQHSEPTTLAAARRAVAEADEWFKNLNDLHSIRLDAGEIARVDAARRDLEEARRTLARAPDDADRLRHASTLASSAAATLRTIVETIFETLDALRRLTSDAEALLSSFGGAHSTPTGERAARLRRLTAEVQTIDFEQEVPFARLEWLRRELETAVAPRPPAPLIAAISAYLSGRYEEVTRLLEPERFDERRAEAERLLFLGAARHSLFLLGGERDERLRQQAAASVASLLELDADFRPDPWFFSPRFRALFPGPRN